MTIEVRGGTALVGYPYFWLKGVTGFDPRQHCAKCLPGPFLINYQRPFPMNQEIEVKVVGSVRAAYLCGVAEAGYRYNLHAPMVPDPHARDIEVPMVKGQKLIIRGGHLLEIPPVKDGFLGKDKTFTTCRNWQFGIAYFGPEGTVGPRKTPLFEL